MCTSFFVSIFQCHLDTQGASDLIVDLVINNFSSRTFRETIELGISLLDGGNMSIQVGLLNVDILSLCCSLCSLVYIWHQMCELPSSQKLNGK